MGASLTEEVTSEQRPKDGALRRTGREPVMGDRGGHYENAGFTLKEMGVLEGFIVSPGHHLTCLEIDHTGCVASRRCVLSQREAAGPAGSFCVATAEVMKSRGQWRNSSCLKGGPLRIC